MAAQAIDLSAGLVPAPAQSGVIDLSAGLTPKTAPAQAQPEGFWHSLGAQFGLTPEASQAAVDEMKAHPLAAAAKAALGPAGALIEGIYNQVKQSGSEAYQAGQSLAQGNPAAAGVHAVQAVPIVGPALSKAADQYGGGDTAGAAGTALGAVAQAAPLALGAADEALPGRPKIPNPSLPSRANAASVFNDLNTKLADQPVPLSDTLAPLQRATEIGVRGGTLPKPISDLLTRSQATEPMTFPEARDYQMSLTDLSREQQASLTPRMKAQVAQVNQGLFNDIHAAAESAQPGLGSDFANAMKEYRQASQVKNAIDAAKKIALPVAATAIAGGGGALALRYLSEIGK